MRKALWLAMLLAHVAADAGTAVYRWVDEEGVLHFGDRPPELDGGRQIKVREPNLVDPVAVTAAPGKRPPTSRPKMGGDRLGRSTAEIDLCGDARGRQRALRAKRRSGYALAEARALDREAESISEAIRRFCR